jgi:FkbH-like protein
MPKNMKLGLCGNIFLDSLAQALDTAIPGTDIIVGRAGEFVAELSEARGEFASLDACIVALDWRDLTPGLYGFAFGDNSDEVMSGFREACGGIKTAIEKYRRVCAAKILVFSPVSDRRSQTGFINRLLQPSPFELFNNCQALFNELCRSMPDVYPVDMEELCARIGSDAAFDPASRFLKGLPFSEAMIRSIAVHLRAMCVQVQKYPLKCLVLDCDNTLWGGIVGETGSANLVLGDDGLGKAYKEFQREILRLHKQGIILTICSKNNTCDVLEVMEQHPHMLIRPSRISCFRINWDDKPKNLVQISAELNIGLDAMMFVDDNPSERGMMAAALPEVEILELPDDPTCFADTLLACTRFWPLQLTKDDAAKGAFFSQERSRRESRELAANVEDYLVKSAIVVTIAQAGPGDEALPRIAQLFNKTNQFNLTSKRYSESQLSSLAGDPRNALFSMAMKDVYGDYGIIAAALVMGNSIDSFLLSCRAFGKRAENAFLYSLLDFLKQRGCKQAFGVFAPSLKNAMTKDFYQGLGFTFVNQAGSDHLWRFDMSNKIPEMPRWITRLDTPLVE